MNNVNSSGRLDWSALTRVPADAAMLDAFGLRPGDVLFNNTNSAELVGKSALFAGFDEPVVFSNHFTRLRTDEVQLAPEFLALWLQDMWNSGLFREICHRWIGQAAVQRDRLLGLEIALPDVSEQTRIAGVLMIQVAEIERARAAAEAQLRVAGSLPAAYLRAVYERRGFGTWPTRALREISDIVGGVQKSPSRVPVSFHRPYLTVRNVQRGYLDQTHIEQFETTADEVARLRLMPGDVLIVEGNGSLAHIGRNALFVGDGQEWIHQNHVIRVRVHEDRARPEFVSRYLNCDAGRRQMVEKAKTTSGLYTLSAGKVGALEVPVPSVLEQDQVLTGLRQRMQEAGRIRLVAELQLEAIRRLPASMLRRAFQGAL